MENSIPLLERPTSFHIMSLIAEASKGENNFVSICFLNLFNWLEKFICT